MQSSVPNAEHVPVETLIEIAPEFDFDEMLKDDPSLDIMWLLNMIKSIYEECVKVENEMRKTRSLNVQGQFRIMSDLSETQANVAHMLNTAKWTDELGFEMELTATLYQSDDYDEGGNYSDFSGPAAVDARDEVSSTGSDAPASPTKRMRSCDRCCV
jgi:hypothetical protein